MAEAVAGGLRSSECLFPPPPFDPDMSLFHASCLRHASYGPFHPAISLLNLEMHTQSDVYALTFARTRLKVLMKHVLSSLLLAVTEMAVFCTVCSEKSLNLNESTPPSKFTY